MNIKVFYKLTMLFLLVAASHAQSIQNSNFVISLQYLKTEGRNEVDFLPADKHQTKLILLMLVGMPHHAQIAQITQNLFAKSLRYSKIWHFWPKSRPKLAPK